MQKGFVTFSTYSNGPAYGVNFFFKYYCTHYIIPFASFVAAYTACIVRVQAVQFVSKNKPLSVIAYGPHKISCSGSFRCRDFRESRKVYTSRTARDPYERGSFSDRALQSLFFYFSFGNTNQGPKSCTVYHTHFKQY